MKMNKRYFSPLLAIAVFATATFAEAAVHKVYPGDSIQAVIDIASPGDTILVEPGVYEEDSSSKYGLRITTNNLRLIGKANKAKGKVRIVANGAQETGVYAAPAGCDYKLSTVQCEAILGEGFEHLKGFYIRGFSVEGFPVNGIQTRWVDGFEFVSNESANNLNNGIYPTLSANGLVRNNESYGSLDTAMWVAGSENVRVIGNELHSSVIGFEITVSNEVQVTQNEIYGNSVGVGLFHPNGAGNPPLPIMANWVIEHNNIYDNNLSPNPAPPGSLQVELPPGVGILLIGVSDNVIGKNNIEGNDFLGLGVLGWCTANGGVASRCQNPPLSSNNNLVALNKFSGNGGDPSVAGASPLVPFAGDILYLQGPPFESAGTGNCFEKNKPKNGLAVFSFPDGLFAPPGALPTDGC